MNGRQQPAAAGSGHWPSEAQPALTACARQHALGVNSASISVAHATGKKRELQETRS